MSSTYRRVRGNGDPRELEHSGAEQKTGNGSSSGVDAVAVLGALLALCALGLAIPALVLAIQARNDGISNSNSQTSNYNYIERQLAALTNTTLLGFDEILNPTQSNVTASNPYVTVPIVLTGATIGSLYFVSSETFNTTLTFAACNGTYGVCNAGLNFTKLYFTTSTNLTVPTNGQARVTFQCNVGGTLYPCDLNFLPLRLELEFLDRTAIQGIGVFISPVTVSWTPFVTTILESTNTEYAPIASSEVVVPQCNAVPHIILPTCFTVGSTCIFQVAGSCGCSNIGGVCVTSNTTIPCINSNPDGTCGGSSIPPLPASSYNYCFGGC